MQFALRSRDYLAGIAYVLIAALSYWVAWLLRFDLSIPDADFDIFYTAGALFIAAKCGVFTFAGLRFDRWSRSRGISDLLRVFKSNVAAAVLSAVMVLVIIGPSFPRSIYLLDFMVCFLATASAMFAVRIYQEISMDFLPTEGDGVLIYGAGVAGIALAREVRDNPGLGFHVLGFLDDDLRKKGNKFMGLRVFGTGEEIPGILETIQSRKLTVAEIVVAMPSATGTQLRAAVSRGKAAGVPSRIVPGLGQLISNRAPLGQTRDISVTDLLGRQQVQLDLDLVAQTIRGHAVLVTGAAGSIGTELCHQIGQFGPRVLVCFEQAESELFRLEADLRAKFPMLHCVFEVGDIRFASQVEQTIERNGITSIFHAAAYKHVPMMERQVCEAVRNNVIGTWNLVQAARRARVSTFLLISTDKAVNPTSIMGLTKRITELIISAEMSSVDRLGQTKFVAVRFGNVLVSNGSVVPTFQKQIAAGGPVTVTHPEMRRYFMTVTEAVQLVLQASAMGRGSEVFVLDMGTPIKIVDLAYNMISLAGFVPEEDIEIRFTGLRPGEKLCEELNLDGENTVATSHPKIRVFAGRQHGFQEIAAWMAELQHALWRRDTAAIVNHMRILVPEYRPDPVPALQSLGERPLASPVPAGLRIMKTAAG